MPRREALEQLDVAGTTQERTQRVVRWLNARMPWVATDYRERTIDQILERGAGNCADHARVLQSLLEERGLRTRWAQEINLQPENAARQTRAEQLIAQRGLAASVFGRQHNDHRWLEVWSPEEQDWFPADSALGVAGTDAWVRARLGFDERPAPVKEMLLPFIVAASLPDGTKEDRSRRYLVDAFNHAYGDRLSSLPAWSKWETQVLAVAQRGLGAFAGTVNLHEHDAELTRLHETYEELAVQASKANVAPR